LKKVCYIVSLFENCQRQSCKAFIDITIRAKMIGRERPLLPEIWVKLAAFERNRRLSIYFRPYSTSAVTPSEISSINTNRKSTIRAFQWAQHEHRMLSLSQGAQRRKVEKFTQ